MLWIYFYLQQFFFLLLLSIQLSYVWFDNRLYFRNVNQNRVVCRLLMNDKTVRFLTTHCIFLYDSICFWHAALSLNQNMVFFFGIRCVSHSNRISMGTNKRYTKRSTNFSPFALLWPFSLKLEKKLCKFVQLTRHMCKFIYFHWETHEIKSNSPLRTRFKHSSVVIRQSEILN